MKVIVEPQDLWRYYLSKKSLCPGEYEIANNDKYGITISLSTSGSLNRPCIIVSADDVELYSEVIVGVHDAEKTCEKIYAQYLSDNVVSILIGTNEQDDETDEPDDEPTEEEIIEAREQELDDAVITFIGGILDEGDDFDGLDSEILDDIKEHFLEYLFLKYGLSVRRPMVLEDEKGEEFFEEYPYPHLIFEDENNPVYKKEI